MNYDEIDLILEAPDGRIVAIEVKAGSTPDLSDARQLIWLRDKIGDQFVGGVVFHTGTRPSKLAPNLHDLERTTPVRHKSDPHRTYRSARLDRAIPGHLVGCGVRRS